MMNVHIFSAPLFWDTTSPPQALTVAKSWGCCKRIGGGKRARAGILWMFLTVQQHFLASVTQPTPTNTRKHTQNNRATICRHNLIILRKRIGWQWSDLEAFFPLSLDNVHIFVEFCRDNWLARKSWGRNDMTTDRRWGCVRDCDAIEFREKGFHFICAFWTSTTTPSSFRTINVCSQIGIVLSTHEGGR